jgi:hypothetical protein
MTASLKCCHEGALDGGFGSAAWRQTPTLADFMEFCTPEQLNVEADTGLICAAQSQIQLQLGYWLNSRVGKAIGRPSSFPTDAQLVVFACDAEKQVDPGDEGLTALE